MSLLFFPTSPFRKAHWDKGPVSWSPASAPHGTDEYHSHGSPACLSQSPEMLAQSILFILGPTQTMIQIFKERAFKSIFYKFFGWFILSSTFENSWEGKRRLPTSLATPTTAPGNLLKMQNLRPHPRLIRWESAFQQVLKVSKVWGTLLYKLYLSPLPGHQVQRMK